MWAKIKTALTSLLCLGVNSCGAQDLCDNYEPFNVQKHFHELIKSNPQDMFEIKAKVATDFVLSHEGLISNNKNDPGGITNRGISLRFIEQIRDDVNRDGKFDREDVLALTLNEVRALYRKYFWDKHRYYMLEDLNLAAKVFDLAVNLGAPEAHTLLQRACNDLVIQSQIIVEDIKKGEEFMIQHHPQPSLKVDGVFGERTIAECNKLNSITLMHTYQKRVDNFYKKLIEQNPKFNEFYKGWHCRVWDY